MPHIGSRLVDFAGTSLIREWIAQLPKQLAEDKADDPAAEKLRPEISELLKLVGSASVPSGQILDRLLASVNGALALSGTIQPHAQPIADLVVEKTIGHPAFQVRDLFERFLPEEKRVQKLGANIKAEAILALQGDAASGRKIFFQEGVQCSRCHRINGEGTDFGPDLSQIAKKYDRPQILENILFPSKIIEPNFIAYSIETKDDLSYSGLILKRTADEIVLKDSTAKEIHLRAGDVKSVQAQSLSVMPELLLQALTVQNVADLLEYLSSLR
jgi:putative heme-binding domain-containing protein